MTEKITAADYLASLEKKPTKYKAEKTSAFGLVFDSKKEANRFGELKILERRNEISELKAQPEFLIEINGVKICKYVADFQYLEKGKIIVEDCKSEITRKHPVYRLKKKLMHAVLGIEIRET